MKKEIVVHLTSFFLLFSLITLLKHFFSLNYLFFWLGGIIGTVLPDIDHLLYIRFLAPQELTSQRVDYMLAKREFWPTLKLLAETRSERKKLIFHTGLFQLIFLVLAFLVITSSGSLLGKGLVVAFFLHLIVDQGVDLFATDGLVNWLGRYGINFDKPKATIYWVSGIILTLLIGLLV